MKLQNKRLAAGMSQSRLAAVSGVNLRTLQNYECGCRNINTASLEILCALASALNCTIFEILDDESLIERIKAVV